MFVSFLFASQMRRRDVLRRGEVVFSWTRRQYSLRSTVSRRLTKSLARCSNRINSFMGSLAQFGNTNSSQMSETNLLDNKCETFFAISREQFCSSNAVRKDIDSRATFNPPQAFARWRIKIETCRNSWKLSKSFSVGTFARHGR